MHVADMKKTRYELRPPHHRWASELWCVVLSIVDKLWVWGSHCSVEQPNIEHH